MSSATAFRRLAMGLALLLAALPLPAGATGAAGSDALAAAYRRWEESPHGRMLKRVLPPGPQPAELPEPESEGARLLTRYCVQCHYLPNPAMHAAGNWSGIVQRMNWRMQGKGNLGGYLQGLMEGVQAPTEDEFAALKDYLARNAQRPIDRKRYPDLASPEGRAFDLACSQCHALPDPRRHSASEWPKVVERMKRHLEWVGTVRGRERNPRGELNDELIVRFLQRHARPVQ